MTITKTLLVAALAAGGLAATAAEAQNQLSRGSGGMQSGASRSGSVGGASIGRGDSHGNWSGRTGGTDGRHWNGGGRGHGHGHGHWRGGRHWHGSYWGPRFGLYFGAPLLWGSYYWGSPYWGSYYYPGSTVVYRERIVEPYPMSVPESYNEFEVSPAEVLPRGEGAPTQAPAYRNYCETAKAYYPKVTTCPEGWRFEPLR